MNWRHFVGAFFLVAMTVFLLNIAPFIHLSMQEQVFFDQTDWFSWLVIQIGYPGEREITLPSCTKVSGPKSLPDALRFVAFSKSYVFKHVFYWMRQRDPAKFRQRLKGSICNLAGYKKVIKRDKLILSRWQVLKNVFRVLKVSLFCLDAIASP